MTHFLQTFVALRRHCFSHHHTVIRLVTDTSTFTSSKVALIKLLWCNRLAIMTDRGTSATGRLRLRDFCSEHAHLGKCQPPDLLRHRTRSACETHTNGPWIKLAWTGVDVHQVNWEILYCYSRPPQNCKFGHFTSLFWREWQRNVVKWKTHVRRVQHHRFC